MLIFAGMSVASRTASRIGFTMGRRHATGPVTVGLKIGRSNVPTWIRSPNGAYPSSRWARKWNSSAYS